MVFIFCSKYVKSNLNQPGRVPKRKGPVMSVSGSECVASVLAGADNDRKMVVIPKETFLEMEENLKILSQSK